MTGEKINRATRTWSHNRRFYICGPWSFRGRQSIVEKNFEKNKGWLKWNEQIPKTKFWKKSFSKRNIKSKWPYNYSGKLELEFKIFHKGSTRLRKCYWWALQNMQGRKNSNLMQIIFENKKK